MTLTSNNHLSRGMFSTEPQMMKTDISRPENVDHASSELRGVIETKKKSCSKSFKFTHSFESESRTQN